MPKAVRFSNYGGVEVLDVVEVDDAPVDDDYVKVSVVSAGINPGEIGIREGAMADRYPATFPSGQGSDFAGIVAAVGANVTDVSVGDEVIGFSDWRNSQSEFVVVPSDHVIPKPAAVDWDTAGSLYVAGTTAIACIKTVQPKAGETLVVAGAAGGVGVLVTQLALNAGAKVIATAGESNHDYLRQLGAVPVTYGDGLEDRIRAAAPDGIDAFVDAHGSGNVQLAVDLGVTRDRINTIADFAAIEQLRVKGNGMATVDSRSALLDLAERFAAGKLTLPVYARYPLREVRAAYARLAERHGLGKIVLEVRPPL
ncbi:NADP-dependent oxidoreductase [Naasia lichenicola]|uniref:NADP-dependent oxidoreductase n=1 Tax=Naasia lichenicola TaxID=2565933 RepID=A0A4S4FS79_9MICO|nr:NADP-dependent oxidoreductase [Naasia lichenicola]THG33244.1 NADP-dependent oxidoreductase [Naasia lichenicola]